ncbi:MAG: hypothetical protein KAU35_00265 [candidate division Zixibacteria bacterium]|nr:hypothetical protein [candidate division Zixibacteria bacterium]
MIAFIAGTLTSLHLHVLPDGRVVVHSHAQPESDSGTRHNHTDQEYKFFAALSQLTGKATETHYVAFECGNDGLHYAVVDQPVTYGEYWLPIRPARAPPR